MRRSLLAILLASCFTACGGPGGNSNPPVDAAGPSPDTASGALTWSGYAQSFFATYCTSCHNAADTTGRDWTRYDLVVSNKLPISCGTSPTALPECQNSGIQPRMFPIGGGPFPSDAERTRVVDWIHAGTPM
jgi:hypothetical protein